MQTVAVDLNEVLGRDKNEMQKVLSEKAIKKGDKIYLFKDKDFKGAMLVAGLFLVLLAVYAIFSNAEKEAEGQGDSDADVQPNSAFGDFQTSEEVEAAIEALGVDVEIRNKKTVPLDPFAETFGIWKNRDIDIEKFRDSAWQKAN